MSTHKAAIIEGPGQQYKISQVPTREPKADEIRIKVSSCGVCYSDGATVYGKWPGVSYPRIPGHEIVGRVDKLGANVDATRFPVGSRVGAGFFGGNCFKCDECLKGDLAGCSKMGLGNAVGAVIDGGFQEYVSLPSSAVVRIPEGGESDAEISPLLCAGVTVYDAIKNADYKSGDLALVQGIGGLGHLAIQFAAKLGMRVVAVSGTSDKKDLALQLGAHDLWTSAEAVEKAQQFGGAKLIITTVTASKAMSEIIPAVARYGTVLLVGVPTDGGLEASPVVLTTRRAQIKGWFCGEPNSIEETVKFALLKDVKALIKTFPLDNIQEAWDDVLTGKPKFRNVIVF
ncbi:zinc-type alcohol dehydrogenase [Atractiella rhizophila]|nr:zinc-type alcohol dehydrogenase [Atractiella rhizophila]